MGVEIWGKRLQSLKEAVPSASKVGFLELRTPYMQERFQALQEISGRLGISLVSMLVEEATPSECQRVFTVLLPFALSSSRRAAQQKDDRELVQGGVNAGCSNGSPRAADATC